MALIIISETTGIFQKQRDKVWTCNDFEIILVFIMLTVIIIYYYHPKFLICFADVDVNGVGRGVCLGKNTVKKLTCVPRFAHPFKSCDLSHVINFCISKATARAADEAAEAGISIITRVDFNVSCGKLKPDRIFYSCAVAPYSNSSLVMSSCSFATANWNGVLPSSSFSSTFAP